MRVMEARPEGKRTRERSRKIYMEGIGHIEGKWDGNV